MDCDCEKWQGIVNDMLIYATIFADTVSVNPASIAILKKIGFIQTYLEEGVFNNNGMKLDLVHFKIERIS